MVFSHHSAGRQFRFGLTTFERNLEFAADLGIDGIRVDTVSPPDVCEKAAIASPSPGSGWCKTFQEGARRAASRGIRVLWEFEPGFAFNKPSEILCMADDVAHSNFQVLYDTCHAHMVAAVGARQPGRKETLPGGRWNFSPACTAKSATST